MYFVIAKDNKVVLCNKIVSIIIITSVYETCLGSDSAPGSDVNDTVNT